MERRHACFRLVWQAPRDFRLRGKRQLFFGEEAWEEEEEQADSDEEEEVLPTEEGVDEPSSTSIGSTAPPFCNIVQVPFVLPFTSHSSKSLTYSASNVNSTDNHYNVEIATWPNFWGFKITLMFLQQQNMFIFWFWPISRWENFHFDSPLMTKISKVENWLPSYIIDGFRKECLDLRHCTLASGETLLILRLPEKSYSEPL